MSGQSNLPAFFAASELPFLPEQWKYTVSDATRKQFETLQNLMNREDVETIVCATDAGREGELIFRLVYEQCACHKPVKRLWISSLEESAIREGFRHLRADSDYDRLYQAALCRQKADWLVGINASRLFSLIYGTTLNVGRVMTPTLALIVQREEGIAHFQPKSFSTVQISSGFLASSDRIADPIGKKIDDGRPFNRVGFGQVLLNEKNRASVINRQAKNFKSLNQDQHQHARGRRSGKGSDDTENAHEHHQMFKRNFFADTVKEKRQWNFSRRNDELNQTVLKLRPAETMNFID